MKKHHLVLALVGGLFLATGASILGMAKLPVVKIAASTRGDRLDVTERAQRCAGASVIAACADSEDTSAARARASNLVQVFEKPGETILVRVKLGD